MITTIVEIICVIYVLFIIIGYFVCSKKENEDDKETLKIINNTLETFAEWSKDCDKKIDKENK